MEKVVPPQRSQSLPDKVHVQEGSSALQAYPCTPKQQIHNSPPMLQQVPA
jgi:hypothetical protein